MFELIIAALAKLFTFLMNWESRTKEKYKRKAVALLEMDDPNPTDVKKIIRNLRLYIGRYGNDKEAEMILDSLRSKYGHLF